MNKRIGKNWPMKIGISFMFSYTIMFSYILLGSWWNGAMLGFYGMPIFTNIYGEAFLEAWILTPIVLVFAFYTFLKVRKL